MVPAYLLQSLVAWNSCGDDANAEGTTTPSATIVAPRPRSPTTERISASPSARRFRRWLRAAVATKAWGPCMRAPAVPAQTEVQNGREDGLWMRTTWG